MSLHFWRLRFGPEGETFLFKLARSSRKLTALSLIGSALRADYLCPALGDWSCGYAESDSPRSGTADCNADLGSMRFGAGNLLTDAVT